MAARDLRLRGREASNAPSRPRRRAHRCSGQQLARRRGGRPGRRPLARELAAPLVFVYVRRGPSSALGKPYYQRRLDAEMRAGRRALDDALAAAERAGVPTTGEQLEGNPARRVVEFAHERGARLIVLGPRRLRLGRSVSRQVIRSADRPVLIADQTAPAAA